MREMGFMEKLLDGVGVEWKSVSEIFDIKNGYTPSKSIDEYWADGSINWFRMDDIREKGNILQESIQKISSSAVKAGKLFPENSIIISTSATIGEHALIKVPHLANQRFTSLSIKSKYKNIFDIKFIFYYCYLLAEWCKKNTTVSSFASVDMDGFRRFSFPVLCPDNPKKSLEIQAEIVRILDAMTAHTAELTAELIARKKQYDYYRDKLLSFEEGEVEWRTLVDVIKTIKTGKLNANAMVDNGNYPFFTCDSKPFRIDTYAFDTEAIIVSGNGSQVGHINYYKGKFNAYQRTYILADCIEEIKIKFLLIYLKAYLRPYIMQHSKKGSVPYITLPMLQSFKVPLPSLEKQIHIISVLEKFEVLTESLFEGLPREIELRQKQYAYYRDLLLSFPAAQAA